MPQTSSYKNAVTAVKKLSPEEKQQLLVQLFSEDIIGEMKSFEAHLKKKNPLIKKTDAEIVALTTSIRKKNYANPKKMLH